MKARFAIALCLIAFALSAPSRSWATHDLPGLDPAYVMSLQSSGLATDGPILFLNQAGFSVNVYWIDFVGAEELYVTLAPGGSAAYCTGLHHPWLVRRTSDSMPMVGFMIDSTAPCTIENAHIARITDQPVPVEQHTWSGIKARFRD